MNVKQYAVGPHDSSSRGADGHRSCKSSWRRFAINNALGTTLIHLSATRLTRSRQRSRPKKMRFVIRLYTVSGRI